VNIKTSEKYLSFDGPHQDALRFVQEIRQTYDEAGMDMGKVLNDFVFNIEVCLQNAGVLDGDFNEITQEAKG
jgi:hypothetical protein